MPTASPPPAPVPGSDSVLDDDYITVPGQLFALVSFVGPSGTSQRNDKFGMKLRGCFASKEEAHSHVRRLQQVDKLTDIYLVDMYKWLLIPPDPNAIDDHQYQESFLNDLIQGYRESQHLAKQHFLERKEAVQRDGIDKHLLEHEKAPAPAAVPAPDSQPGPGTVDRSMFEQADPLLERRLASAPAPAPASASASAHPASHPVVE